METGPANWLHQASLGADTWELVAGNAHSAAYAWHALDSFDSQGKIGQDSWLQNATPLKIGNGSRLTFWHRYNFDNPSYDGAVLEISLDGGDHWSDLGPYVLENGYNGTINGCCSNPLGGRSGWVNDLEAWTQVTVDLSSFEGQSAFLRWRIGSDLAVGDRGWYIDDVRITSNQPPEAAPTIDRIYPDHGSPGSSHHLRIYGSHFQPGAIVRLGDALWMPARVANQGLIEVDVPAGLAEGKYTVFVVNGDCLESSLEGGYTSSAESIDIDYRLFLPNMLAR